MVVNSVFVGVLESKSLKFTAEMLSLTLMGMQIQLDLKQAKCIYRSDPLDIAHPAAHPGAIRRASRALHAGMSTLCAKLIM